jgi:hypothetical protein
MTPPLPVQPYNRGDMEGVRGPYAVQQLMYYAILE